MERILMAGASVLLLLPMVGCCYTPAGYDACGQPYGCCIRPCCCGPLDPFCLSCGNCGNECDDDDGCFLFRGLKRCICGPSCCSPCGPACGPTCGPSCGPIGCGDCGALPAPMVPGAVMTPQTYPAPVTNTSCGCAGYGPPQPNYISHQPSYGGHQSYLPPTTSGPGGGQALYDGTVYYEPSSSYYSNEPNYQEASQPPPVEAPPARAEQPPQDEPMPAPMPMSGMQDARAHRWIPVRL